MSPDLHHLSGAYAVDALDEHERASFEQHLLGCPDCRAEVAELTAAGHALAALDETTPPPALRDAVLSSIRTVRPLPPTGPEDAVMAPPATPSATPSATPPAGPPAASPTDSPTVAPGRTTPTEQDRRRGATVLPWRRRTSTWLVAAAAAVAVAVGGLVWAPWADPSPYDQVVAAADARTVTSSKEGTTATVTWSRQLGRSAITVTGLPPAGEDRDYQLWYADDAGAMHPAGVFDTGGDGSASTVLEGDVNTATAVGVTVEPAGGSPAPTSEPLMVMSLA